MRIARARRALALLCALLVGLCGPLCALAEAIDYADGELEAAQAALFRLGFYEGDCATEAEACTGKLNRATLAALGRYLSQMWGVTTRMYMTREEFDVLLAVSTVGSASTPEPEPEPTPTPEPEAQAAPVRWVRVSSALSGYDAYALVDGQASTSWRPDDQRDSSPWAEFQFTQPVSLTGVSVRNGCAASAEEYAANRRARVLQVEYSTDGATYALAGSYPLADGQPDWQTVPLGPLSGVVSVRVSVPDSYAGSASNSLALGGLQWSTADAPAAGAASPRWEYVPCVSGLPPATNRAMNSGEQSPAVLWLQLALQQIGYYADISGACVCTGSYGKRIHEAIGRFEMDYGLPDNRVIDDRLLQAVASQLGYPVSVPTGGYYDVLPPLPNEGLQKGQACDAALWLQRMLNELGQYAGALNGICDTALTNAVQAYQPQGVVNAKVIKLAAYRNVAQAYVQSGRSALFLNTPAMWLVLR